MKIKYGIEEHDHWFEECYVSDILGMSKEYDDLELYADTVMENHYHEHDGWEWGENGETYTLIFWDDDGTELARFKTTLQFRPYFEVYEILEEKEIS